MLINHKEQIVIYVPFKNYSTSLCKYFEPLDEWQELHRQHLTIAGDCYDRDSHYEWTYKHGNMPPTDCLSYTKILPLRNPYERIISAWKWACRNFNIELTFEDFFNYGAKYPTIFPVSRFYPHDLVVRTENIVEDFDKCGIAIDESAFPHLNKHGSSLEHELTETEKAIIYWWHREDFIAGNYEK